MINMSSYSKSYKSDTFNYIFDNKTGYTATWGATYKEDPLYAPFPLIVDMEITTICNGIGNFGPCEFCYKSNTAYGKIMAYPTATKIIDKLPKHTTQIAFGTDATLESNPYWYKIFLYARKKDIVPNVTVAQISDNTAEKIASVCGAVAVSVYKSDKNICYDSVKKLTDHNLTQTNIHCMLSKETLPLAYEVIEDIYSDSRLKNLNALVFLSLKKKGLGKRYTPLSYEEFQALIYRVQKSGIRYGFDSCSGHKFLKAIRGTVNEQLAKYCTPCESTRESCYINVNGRFYPCSFTEGISDWLTGLNVLDCNDFITDIWNNPKTVAFRNKLIQNKCRCPIYEV